MNRELAPVVFLVLTLPAVARDKTDLVVMQNGDRLTCEVKKLESGVLEVSLDYADGNVYIDWSKVVRLESKAEFVVRLEDGSTLAGRVITPKALAGPAVRLEIVGTTELEPIPVERREVVSMTQTSSSFLHRFDGGLTLGTQYSKGNSTTQYNLGSDIGYQATRWGATAQFNSNLSSSEGADTATRNQFEANAYRLLRVDRYFYTGSASYLQSSVQGIESQVALAGGIGAFVKRTNRTEVRVLGGPGWQRTRYREDTAEQTIQDIGVFAFSANLSAFRFKKTRLESNLDVMPAFTDLGRVFLRAKLTYYLKLFGKFDWNLSVFGNFDNQPPAHLPGSDYGSSLGLSWSFGNH